MKIKMNMIVLVVAIVALMLSIILPTIVQGPVGPQGIQGIQGLQGETGETGATGPNGTIGPNGSQGPKGDVGENGSQGIPGTIRGAWVLVGTLTGLGSQSFNLSLGMNSPVKIFWRAISTSNDSCLIVKLVGDGSEGSAIWRETSFIPLEEKCGIEVTLVNPNEAFTLTLQAKWGGFSYVTADIYRFASSP
jgi:hypothetical protein